MINNEMNKLFNV